MAGKHRPKNEAPPGFKAGHRRPGHMWADPLLVGVSATARPWTLSPLFPPCRWPGLTHRWRATPQPCCWVLPFRPQGALQACPAPVRLPRLFQSGASAHPVSLLVPRLAQPYAWHGPMPGSDPKACWYPRHTHSPLTTSTLNHIPFRGLSPVPTAWPVRWGREWVGRAPGGLTFLGTVMTMGSHLRSCSL